MPRIDDIIRERQREGAAGFTEGDVAVAQSLDMSAIPDDGSIAPFQRQPVSRPEIAEAYQTLLNYKRGKANLERRIVENERWYRLRQWECLRRDAKQEIEPASAWLLNAISNKHADAMDNFPAANILPREEGDKGEAKTLSAIIPVVLDQCSFEQTYSDLNWKKLIAGTGCYGVFWDKSKCNGLGDIDIASVDLISLFWESGITDIQQSRNLFYVYLMDNDLLEQDYPQLKDKLGNPVLDVAKYIYDDTVDTNDKSAVVDWYYKKRGANGKTVLHYCKFIAGQDEALFATENDEQYAERGWYDDGLYPFVFDSLFPCEGTPAGFGYLDIGKSAQEYIDRGDQALMENMLFNARPRHFVRSDGAVNEKEFADTTKDFVHVDGNLGDDSIRPIPANGLNSIYVTLLTNKIQELKEVTGNRDVNTGGTSSGATAASAIAAMQEAGSKLSRDMNKGSFRAYRQVITMCIERIRQFYDVARCFRITGNAGSEEFVQFDNGGLQPQPQGTIVNGVPTEMGMDVGYRLPCFDIEVTAEKQSPYSKMAQNELALQFYAAGFFAPQNADAALACLDMMDFDHKDFVTQKIEQNGTLYQQLMQAQQLAMSLAARLDALTGSQNAAALAQMQGGAPMPGDAAPGAAMAEDQEALGATDGGESSITKNARQRVADSTVPR